MSLQGHAYASAHIRVGFSSSVLGRFYPDPSLSDKIPNIHNATVFALADIDLGRDRIDVLGFCLVGFLLVPNLTGIMQLGLIELPGTAANGLFLKHC